MSFFNNFLLILGYVSIIVSIYYYVYIYQNYTRTELEIYMLKCQLSAIFGIGFIILAYIKFYHH